MSQRGWSLFLVALALLAGESVAPAQSQSQSSNPGATTQILSIQPNPANMVPLPRQQAPSTPVTTVSIPSSSGGATPVQDPGMAGSGAPMTQRPPVQTTPDAAPPSAGDGVLRLRLALHELILLQEAAHQAGGDLRITIDPVGITTEDLIVPLARDPELLVKREGDVIIVSTRSPDSVSIQLRQEVEKLEERRRALLQDISVLERLSNSKSPLPPSQPSQ